MQNTAPLLALLATLAAAIGSMRLWWLQAPINETRYLIDYCASHSTFPAIRLWRYRIEEVQHLPIMALPDVYDGRPLYQVILWPLIATVAVGMCSLVLAAIFSSGVKKQDKVIRGPRLVSHRQFNLRTIFKRRGAFYIETR
jgi:hypothetical protein